MRTEEIYFNLSVFFVSIFVSCNVYHVMTDLKPWDKFSEPSIISIYESDSNCKKKTNSAKNNKTIQAKAKHEESVIQRQKSLWKLLILKFEIYLILISSQYKLNIREIHFTRR